MDYGQVVDKFLYGIGWYGLKVKCGYCKHINKHGILTDRTGEIDESRTCDRCFKDYRFIVNI